jgi:hypothetical protein
MAFYLLHCGFSLGNEECGPLGRCRLDRWQGSDKDGKTDAAPSMMEGRDQQREILGFVDLFLDVVRRQSLGIRQLQQLLKYHSYSTASRADDALILV